MIYIVTCHSIYIYIYTYISRHSCFPALTRLSCAAEFSLSSCLSLQQPWQDMDAASQHGELESTWHTLGLASAGIALLDPQQWVISSPLIFGDFQRFLEVFWLWNHQSMWFVGSGLAAEIIGISTVNPFLNCSKYIKDSTPRFVRLSCVQVVNCRFLVWLLLMLMMFIWL